MKIITVLGARPQFIKAALLSHELRRENHEIIVHTGQHYDTEMSDIFFKEMNIPEPDYNLGVGSASHAYQTAEMMLKLEKIFVNENPDLVLVYGDTNSTLAGAITASKLNLPVAHVEAGPRMFDKTIPEEINRIITDQLSSLLFAPTPRSVDNLTNEGLNKGIHLTGDIMLDNFKYFYKKAEKHSKILEELDLTEKNYILTTIHRARNTESIKNLKTIVKSLLKISEVEKIIFPVHPRTKKYLKKYNFYDRLNKNPNIKLINPVGYLDMLILTKNAKKIITDSGGLQKEAYFAQVPCITLDKSSAWPETVEDGWNLVIYGTSEKIARSVLHFKPSSTQNKTFGHGNASVKITHLIEELLKNREKTIILAPKMILSRNI
ncbi:UDP-N-acetylglucosamine 2-epimerase (non-hydrolyzing) [Methanobacterium sp.]|uniref:non-hydrolyzing UDP-N-acetylglucosamine 2-epimerase n=1 Tax=Methanobacterium sp. TaxID=2164 RepID=UPI0031587E8F